MYMLTTVTIFYHVFLKRTFQAYLGLASMSQLESGMLTSFDGLANIGTARPKITLLDRCMHVIRHHT
jgi:hypothetical protein